jgi:plasmid stabilization system protein ParE
MSDSCQNCDYHRDRKYVLMEENDQLEAAIAAATKHIEEVRGAIHYFSDSDNRGTLWKEIEAMDGSQLASYLMVESDKQESYIDSICQEKAAATKRADLMQAAYEQASQQHYDEIRDCIAATKRAEAAEQENARLRGALKDCCIELAYIVAGKEKGLDPMLVRAYEKSKAALLAQPEEDQ